MLELKMDDCLTRGDSSQLVSLLHYEGLTSTTLTTLDQLVTKELSGSGFSRVLVVLRSLEILSENRDDLQTLIDHGLITKVLSWFEAVRDLLTSDLQKSSTPPLSLTEGFYDYFLLLGQSSLPVSQLSVVLLQLALSALEPKVVFALRLEAIRTFNSILESLSRELRKLIQNNQNLTLSLTVIICLSDRSQVAEAVLTVGDYELQVSLSEALCRLTPRKDRQQRANQWFSSPDISNAFCDIRDGDFEVDCRRFLNFVNSCHGDDRRVYTFPCRRAFLDSTELFRPKDDKLDEFWIDFNLDSRCVSFFIDEPQSSPRVTDSGGTVQVSPSAARSSGASYSRKKPQSKSQLKILPLSSPSSEEDSSVTTTPVGRRAEFLFDQIRHSTPTYNSGVPVGAELEISQVQEVEFDGSGSLLQQEVFSSNRKRAATDSGYLSGQTEGPSAQRRKAEPQSEKEESASALPEWPREGAEPSVEEEGPFDGGAESSVKREEPVNEPESDLTSGITTAFKAFKAQLEQHFTSCWQKLEAEVLLSLKECQQHISSLLTAVHQHRLVLLQSFENSITDQLSQLEENSASLNSINAQILSFFQSEMQRLGSFCEEQHQRLKSLEKAESGEDRLSSQ
ncbi:synaptonemal complex protein 2-like isoform X6 [Thunnus albacares]|uniref:synaptonemal complex protein 2-like isoform X6 n=1 Tax=Thunnus albacares TaxID=8236 RepID=UPI001CF61BEA|nr:synaptonemal complex protein 2-like isoform X6 [Thunnus albacares]